MLVLKCVGLIFGFYLSAHIDWRDPMKNKRNQTKRFWWLSRSFHFSLVLCVLFLFLCRYPASLENFAFVLQLIILLSLFVDSSRFLFSISSLINAHYSQHFVCIHFFRCFRRTICILSLCRHGPSLGKQKRKAKTEIDMNERETERHQLKEKSTDN